LIHLYIFNRPNCINLILTEICGQPHSYPGFCLALFYKWSYNSVKNKCVKFVYGGCGKNKNNFNSKKECEDKCLP
ncbi:hypothetical protein KR084_011718, partial [Drosophila pseudotakahashii]